MRKRPRTALASVLALVLLPVLGMAPAAADPLPVEGNACGAKTDYPQAPYRYLLVGEWSVPPSAKARYWHVVDLAHGFYVGAYVVYCDGSNIMQRHADLTRDHDNTEPAQRCEYATFATLEESPSGRDEAQYHYLGSRVSATLVGFDPLWRPVYRDFRYAYWAVLATSVRYNPPSAIAAWVSDAARCPVGQSG